MASDTGVRRARISAEYQSVSYVVAVSGSRLIQKAAAVRGIGTSLTSRASNRILFASPERQCGTSREQGPTLATLQS